MGWRSTLSKFPLVARFRFKILGQAAQITTRKFRQSRQAFHQTTVFRLLYNILLLPVAILATPFWLLKTHKRGGLSERLLEKLARYDAESPEETGYQKNPIYVHAVSVGEGNIARKLITLWSEIHPDERFLLAMGTSTGFDLARKSPPPQTEVMYAPLDFPLFIDELFALYRPALIVLIEHEVWPNMMHAAQKHGVPVGLANARLSQRSGKRLAKLRPLLGGMYEKLSWVGAQSDEDKPRLADIGISKAILHTIGSVKFDPARETPATSSFDPSALLSSLGDGPIFMALSTHAGEELIFARAAAKVFNARIVIIPRHMERRDEITRELSENGFDVLLRSTEPTSHSESSTQRVLVVDSTGEMPSFTRHAQVAFIGKTLTAQGGQNPCEAIAAGVPLIAGTAMGNFEPLVSELRERKGIRTVASELELAQALEELTKQPELRREQSESALDILEAHRGATERTVDALAKLSNRE